MEDAAWVGIAGIVGTLLGGHLANRNVQRAADKQRAHENRTRYHAARLEVYADFNDAANKVVAWRLLGATCPEAVAAKFLVATEKLRLIGSRPVRDALRDVHALATDALEGPVDGDDFNAKMAQLCAAMTTELGVDDSVI